jgi:hypothetical protein
MEDLPDEDQKKFMKDVSKLIRTTGVPKGYWYEMVKGLPANIGAMIFYDRYSKSSPEVQEQMMQGAMPYKLLTGSFNREFIKLQMKEYE